jgi:hypothetical protein
MAAACSGVRAHVSDRLSRSWLVSVVNAMVTAGLPHQHRCVPVAPNMTPTHACARLCRALRDNTPVHTCTHRRYAWCACQQRKSTRRTSRVCARACRPSTTHAWLCVCACVCVCGWGGGGGWVWGRGAAGGVLCERLPPMLSTHAGRGGAAVRRPVLLCSDSDGDTCGCRCRSQLRAHTCAATAASV